MINLGKKIYLGETEVLLSISVSHFIFLWLIYTKCAELVYVFCLLFSFPQMGHLKTMVAGLFA